MLVTHLGKFYPPVPGGMERVLQSLAEGERAVGVDTRALVVATGGQTVRETMNGVPVTRAASLLRVGSVWFAPALVSLLARVETDILVLHEPNPMALLAYCLTRPRHRLIIWYHSEVLRPRWRYRLIYEPFLNVPLRRAQRIVVSSPALLEHAAPLRPHARRCEVIPFGLDVGLDAASHPSVNAVRSRWKGLVALFVGRLVPYKGADVLLRAKTTLSPRGLRPATSSCCRP
jgi:rhamnosyl/mannosyltransferase